MRHCVIRFFGKEDGVLKCGKHTVLTVFLLACQYIYIFIYLCIYFFTVFLTLNMNSYDIFQGTVTIVLVIRYLGLDQSDEFGVILDFTGGIASSFICFVMPAAIYLRLTSMDQIYYWPSASMFLFGIFVLITVPTLTIINLSNNK